ncbi:hypothetical protein AVEN_123001-1 [Araneus ventricosus]|uniref:Peptidase aspartic putative domain-containing protein n=1 Tax=Araneus ventricosus TaxID=182803 RepID=A0A4Y2CVE7_ARAVE|nr:hypothetical protein AVEN_123001-1 [Araneus ventricosus]
MTREEKKTAVLRKGLCLVCLRNGHMAKKCHSNVRCVLCLKRHYAILCPELLNTSKNVFPKQDKKEENTSTLFTIPSSPKTIYLKTLVVRLKNGGRSQYVRALLDDGSHRSYIEKDLARELRLLPSGKETLSQGLFGGNQTPEAENYRYTINVERIDGKFSCQMSVLDQPKIYTTLPRVREKHLLAELENHGIVLTDIGAETPPIRFVLGADNFEIPKIWELENLGIVDPTERKATKLLENETLAHFQETVKKIDNRYEVALPWLAGHPPVYDMYDVAESRLLSVTKRLLKENIFEAYDDVLRQWPVIKPSSATTKVRPVFDAFFKRPDYASLNECLSVGPSLSEQIPPLLLRFRSGTIGVISDIKQAFLQLSVRHEDRDFLRLLWWNVKDRSKLEFLRHCRVVLGVTSSPFLLNACIRHHLSSTEYQLESLQTTVEELKRGFYVDNLTTVLKAKKN